MRLFQLFTAFLLLLTFGCTDHSREEKASAVEERVSDHAHFEEAKAITKEILEVMHQVEGEKFTEKEFKTIVDLQKQLNLLVYELDEQEMEDLNHFRETLMLEKAEEFLISETEQP